MHTRRATLALQPAESPTGRGPARTFRIPGAPGTVEFISPLGEHFCQNCNRLRLTADGKLHTCLVIPGEISLRSALGNNQPLEDFFLLGSRPQASTAQPGFSDARRLGAWHEADWWIERYESGDYEVIPSISFTTRSSSSTSGVNCPRA